MPIDLWTPLFGFLCVIATGFFGWLRTRNHSTAREQAEVEMNFQATQLSFSRIAADWGTTHEEIRHLMDTSTIDRVMIFVAWNGNNAPRWTTAVLQIRQGEQDPISYIHYALDDDYRDRMVRIGASGTAHVRTADLESCKIKRTYEVEQVTEAIWSHISKEQLPGSKAVAHTYCSWATHDPVGIDAKTATRCMILTGRLKGIAASLNAPGVVNP